MNGNSRYACIDGFAEEFDDIPYKGINNWFVSFRSLFNVYSAHFSYFVVFFTIIGCGLLSHRHSVENGKKYTQFWLGALIHGIVSEFRLTASKYWHAQAPVMFFGKQLPLHMLFFYPSVIYVAMMIVQKLKLNACTEPAAVGLLVMLMEMPYRMISVKFLHITYHDSDPMYYHKLCGVPWVEVFSALVFSSSYVALYHGLKYYQSKNLTAIWDKSNPSKKETLTTILCGILSPLFGFLQKIVLFHCLHDLFNVNPASCLFFVFSVYFAFVICFEPKMLQKNPAENDNGKIFLFYQVSAYLGCFLCLALFGKPQNEISIGSHEPIGDCSMLIRSRTPLGRLLKRKKFLCADEVSTRKSFVYNFDCLEKGPPSLHAIWYTICGSPIPNRPQFFLNVLSFVLLICTCFFKTMLSDGPQVEAGKRLILRFRSRYREKQEEVVAATANPTEEEVVGYVLINNESQTLPSTSSVRLRAKSS